MSYALLAASALPYVAAAFQDKPDRPGYTPIEMPDRSGYQNMLLNMGFNPDSESYVRASDALSDRVNRALGRSGMQGSSVGAQLMANQHNMFQQSIIDEQLKRASQALNTVQQGDIGTAQVQAGQNTAAYNAAMNAYNSTLQNQAQGVQGMAGLIGAGARYFGQQQGMPQPPAPVPVPQPQYGTPGFQYESPTFGPIGGY